MSDNPYDVGTWLAEQFKAPGERVTDTDIFLWTGRAAQPIDSIEIAESAGEDGELQINFKDVGTIVIADKGRSCCESRYMSCDDNLSSFVGARIVHIDVEAGGDCEEGSYGDAHEQQFLKVKTTNGDFTVVTHNEHNGYYGGFSIDMAWKDIA